MQTKVINLFGGPNCGKSTTAAGLFHYLKIHGFSTELVTEYVKDLVWEDYTYGLADQLSILAQQNRRLRRLNGKVEYIITDAPLIQGMAYVASEPPEYFQAVKAYFHLYDNVSFFLRRNKLFPFQSTGRIQISHETADAYDTKIEGLLPTDTITLDVSGDYLTQIRTHLQI